MSIARAGLASSTSTATAFSEVAGPLHMKLARADSWISNSRRLAQFRLSIDPQVSAYNQIDGCDVIEGVGDEAVWNKH